MNMTANSTLLLLIRCNTYSYGFVDRLFRPFDFELINKNCVIQLRKYQLYCCWNYEYFESKDGMRIALVIHEIDSFLFVNLVAVRS